MATEHQNEYQKDYPNIKLGWNWASNNFPDTLNDAEHFLRSFVTALDKFYITFATVSEYPNGNPNVKTNIKMNIKMATQYKTGLKLCFNWLYLHFEEHKTLYYVIS